MIPSANIKGNDSTIPASRIASGRSLNSRKLQLVVLLALATVVVSICTHVLAAWLKIETKTATPWMVGPSSGEPMAFLAGSSLAGDGISWKRVSMSLGQRIGGWSVAGASPCEMEILQDKASETKTTFIVVSAYDLNEAILSDFRADVVPLRHTITELVLSNARWGFSKRVISQYPTKWLRALFPTVGRSRGILGELNVKFTRLVSGTEKLKSEAGPSLSFDGEDEAKGFKSEKISDWSPGQTARKLSAMRLAFRGEHSFDGLKRRALERMLRYADEKGRVIIVVLPVSPVYTNEFLTTKVMREFEDYLADLQRSVPRAEWVRLDQLPRLQSNDNFWDLVHMNSSGQQISTDALLGQLGQNIPQQ